MNGPDIAFWQRYYREGFTPWDDGTDDPELLRWLEAGVITQADAPALVPGCGSGRDVALLAARGIAAVGIDYTPEAVALARRRLQAAGLSPQAVVEADVLTWQPPAPAGVIIERTCLCALHPDHWQRYARQLHAWLRPGGRMFAQFEQGPRPDSAQGLVEGPPFHCDITAMRALFPQPAWRWPEAVQRIEDEDGEYHLTAVLERR